jgi:ankyrin repeat protein
MSSDQQLTQEEYDIIIEDARFGDLETLQEIFAEIPAIKLLDIKNEDTLNTTLHMASANGHLATVKYLLELLPKNQANKLINAQNYQGNTALHWASLNGHLEVVKYLCDNYQPDVFLKNKFNHDSIFEAENNNRDEIEQYFLEKFSIEEQNEQNDDDDDKTNSDNNTHTNKEEDKDITFSNKDKAYYDNIEIRPGSEIEQITKETLESLESNEEFIEKKTSELQI